MQLAISWLVLAFGFWLATQLVSGVKVRGGFTELMIVAAIFGVLNFFLGVFVRFFVGVASLGILFFFGFVLRVVANAVLLKLSAALTDRLEVKGFGPALVASFVISAVGIAADQIVR